MPAVTDVKISLQSDISEKLDRVAATTKRSRAALAEEAVAAYVDQQLSIIEGINRGLADMAEERLVSHADAMSEVEAAIHRAERRHRM